MGCGLVPSFDLEVVVMVTANLLAGISALYSAIMFPLSLVLNFTSSNATLSAHSQYATLCSLPSVIGGGISLWKGHAKPFPALHWALMSVLIGLAGLFLFGLCHLYVVDFQHLLPDQAGQCG